MADFDPDRYLKRQQIKEFDPDTYLAVTGPQVQPTAEPDVSDIALGATSPAVTGAAYSGSLGVNPQAIAQTVKPAWDVAKEVYKGPMGVVRGAADVTMMAHGIPPLAGGYGAAESLTAKAEAVRNAAMEASKGLSQTPLTTNPATGSTYPSGVPDYRAMGRAVPEAAEKLSSFFQPGQGGPNALKAWLQSPEAAEYLKNPAFRDAAESYLGKVPSYLSQAGKVVAPVVKGAARVLGPAGLAYDVYQAGQVARDTQLGERLAQGQGGLAQQAYRQGLGMTYQGPQLSPQEAQNVLSSGSQRDIQYFGGADRLTEMIRKKAAEKVLGPVVPGSF